jgi:hypothetical protein
LSVNDRLYGQTLTNEAEHRHADHDQHHCRDGEHERERCAVAAARRARPVDDAARGQQRLLAPPHGQSIA